MEGAGCAEYNGVNCRCESILKAPDGRLIYVEAGGFPMSRSLRQYKRWWHELTVPVPLTMQISIYHKSTNSWSIYSPAWRDPSAPKYPGDGVPLSVENICRYVNSLCGTNFDRVVVLPWDEYGGYYTMNDAHTKYNRGDTFHYQPRIAKKRREKVAELEELHKRQFGIKYDNTSYWVGDDKKLHMQLNVSDEKRIAAGYDKRNYIIEI